MKLYWNQFRALLWKEYHEAKWVMLGGVAVFVGTLIFSINYDGLGRVIHNRATHLEILWQASLVLTFLFFLPLLSRESERDTLVCLKIKPLKPELYALFNWLAGLIVTVLAIILMYTIIAITIVLIGLMTSTMPEVPSPRLGFLPILILFIVLLHSFFFYFCSSCTSNRLRSFGVVLALIPSIFLVLDYASRSDGYLNNVMIFFNIQLVFNLIIAISLLALLSFALIRLRMTHTLTNWLIYSGLLIILCGSYFSLMSVNLSSYNITAVAPQPEDNEDMVFAVIEDQILGRGQKLFDDRHFINQIRSESQTDIDMLSELGETHLDWVSAGNGRHLVQLNGNQYLFNFYYHRYQRKLIMSNFVDKDNFKDKASELEFAIATYDQQLNINTIFEKPLGEVFQFEDKKTQELIHDSYILHNENAWEYVFTEDSGLIVTDEQDFIRMEYVYDYYNRPLGGYMMMDEEAQELYQKYKNAKLLATFTLDDEPTITPVETIEFRFDDPSLEPYTIECVEPGLFLMNETQIDFETLPDADPYSKYSIGEKADQNSIGENHNLEFGRKANLLDMLIFNQGMVKDSIMINLMVNQRMFSLDISTPGKMVINFAQIPWDKKDQFPYPNSVNKAIYGDILIYSYNAGMNEFITLFDISNPTNIKWLKDIKLPFTWRMSNWHFKGDIAIHDDILSINHHNALCLYRLDEHLNIHRISKSEPKPHLNKIAIKDQTIFSSKGFNFSNYSPSEAASPINTLANYQLKQFELTDAEGLPQPPEEPVLLGETGIYGTTRVMVYSSRRSEEPVLLGETEVYQTIRKNLMSLSSRMNDVIEKYLDVPNNEAEEVQDDQQN